jgi:hypothetical protein
MDRQGWLPTIRAIMIPSSGPEEAFRVGPNTTIMVLCVGRGMHMGRMIHKSRHCFRPPATMCWRFEDREWRQ